MVPTVLLGRKDDPVADEVEGFVFGEIGKRSGKLFGAVPDGARFPGGSVGNVNGPRIRANRKKGETLLEAVDAEERDLLAIRGPTGHGVAIHGGSKVA